MYANTKRRSKCLNSKGRSSRAETLPKPSLHLQDKCRVAQIPSDGKGNRLYPEPMEVSYGHDKCFKLGVVSVFVLLQ